MNACYRRLGAAAIGIAIASALAGCSNEQGSLPAARSHLDKGQVSAALVHLKTYLQKEPSSGEARFLLGKALVEQGDVPSGLIELRRAQEYRHPASATAPVIAKALLDLGQAKQAVEEFGTVELADAQAAATLATTLAVAYRALNQPQQSDESLAKALRSVPQHPQALLFKAVLAASGGDYDSALQIVSSVIAANPGLAQAWVVQGSVQRYGKDDLDAASKSYAKAIELQPKLSQAHSELAGIHFVRRDFDAAQRQIEQMRKALPKSYEAVFLQGQLAVLKGDHKGARPHLQQLLRVAPDNWRALMLAGANELQLNSLFQAETFLNKAIASTTPQFEPASNLLARVHLAAGKPAKALHDLRMLLSQQNPTAETLALAGEAHLALGEVEQAEQYFTRSMRGNPDNTAVRTALALTQLAKGRADLAFPELTAIAAADKSTVADMALVTAHLKRGDHVQALKAVEGLQAKQPDKPQPAHLRGRVLLLKPDVAGARAAFERALALDPLYLPAAESLAQLDVKEKKFDTAAQRFEPLLRAQPQDVGAMLAVAQVRIAGNAPADDVVALLRQAQSADPTDPAPRLMLVNYHLARKAPQKAELAAQEAVAALPENPALLDALGRTQQLTGASERAIATFAKLATVQPQSPVPHLRIAEVQAARANMAEAVRSVKQALEVSPDYAPAQAALIGYSLRTRQLQQALAVAKHIQTRKPRDPVGYIVEGDIHAAQKNWPAAEAAYRASLKLPSPENLGAQKLHMMLMLTGKTEEAESFAETWLKSNAADTRLMLQSGSFALARGDLQRAEERFRAVLGVQPAQPQALNNVAWLMARQGRAGGVPLAEQAVAASPDNPVFLDTLALALAAEGQTDRAIATQEKAVALLPADGSLQLHLAKLYAKAGKKSLAGATLDKLSQLGSKFNGQAEVEKLRKELAAG